MPDDLLELLGGGEEGGLLLGARGISSTVSTPSWPTMAGMLRHRFFRPYSPSSTAEMGSMADSFFTMHSAMRATAMAMP